MSRTGYMAATAVDDNGSPSILVCGGRGPSGSLLSDMWLLDSKEDKAQTWSRPNSLGASPLPRAHHR